jgi:G:T-mismatch repair DNA endonuclease (very short patch repair protein)
MERKPYRKFRPTRGKTYLEIYGTSTPACGFKKGDQNVAKLPEVRKKLSAAIKGRCCAFSGKTKGEIEQLKIQIRERLFRGQVKGRLPSGYRTKLEEEVAGLLNRKGISFEYERPLQLGSGRIVVPDFTLDNFYIEASGYCFTRNSSLRYNFKKFWDMVCNGYKVIIVTNCTLPLIPADVDLPSEVPTLLNMFPLFDLRNLPHNFFEFLKGEYDGGNSCFTHP